MDEPRANLKTELMFDQDNSLAKSLEVKSESKTTNLTDSTAVMPGQSKFLVEIQQENTESVTEALSSQ